MTNQPIEFVRIPAHLKPFRPVIAQGLRQLNGGTWPVLDDQLVEPRESCRIALDDDDIELIVRLQKQYEISERDIILSAILVADLVPVNYQSDLTKDIPESVWFSPLRIDYLDGRKNQLRNANKEARRAACVDAETNLQESPESSISKTRRPLAAEDYSAIIPLDHLPKPPSLTPQYLMFGGLVAAQIGLVLFGVAMS